MTKKKILTFGEIMARFSTCAGEKIVNAAQLSVHYGGSEANVAVSLANFGLQSSFMSVVPANELGKAVKKHLRSSNVEISYLLESGERLGTYYLESGVGVRAANVIYDRKYSSFASLTSNPWSFDEIFQDVELFHLSGISPALSTFHQELCMELVREAKKRAIRVSYDSNYRAKLWSQEAAGTMLERILPEVDYLSVSSLDLIYLLKMKAMKPTADYEYYYRQLSASYPNLKAIYATKREIVSASENYLQGVLWLAGEYTESDRYHIPQIVDRVGGGDAYTSGILYGILCNIGRQETVDFATAAAVLKHSIHGDCNEFDVAEVCSFLENGSGKIKR